MEYTIRPLWLREDENREKLEDEIIKILVDKKISIEDALGLFNGIMCRLTGSMPISTDTIE